MDGTQRVDRIRLVRLSTTKTTATTTTLTSKFVDRRLPEWRRRRLKLVGDG